MPNEKDPGPPDLRSRAEALHTTSNVDIARMSQEELFKLVHEFQVHQIELEIQNEELNQAQVELSEARDLYADLYDFAPVGYLTVGRDGIVIRANLTVTNILETERSKLIGSRLSNLVSREDVKRFSQHLEAAFLTREKQVEDFAMTFKNEPMIVRLESVVSQSATMTEEVCRIGLTDITTEREAQALRLEQQLYRASDDEKAKIARCLHDDLGSLLKGIDLHLSASAIRLRDSEPEVADQLKMLVEKVGEAVSLTKDLSMDLHPVGCEWATFHEALRGLGRLAPGIDFQLLIPDEPIQLPDENTANHLFRIAQESVHNAIRHSRATSIVIRLERESRHISLSISDNGCGFDPDKVTAKGLGQQIMQHRARSIGWSLRILSDRSTGTTVACQSPKKR